MSNTRTFIMGAVYGAAIGGALGLLFAPKSGAETRQQLSDQAEWLRTRTSDAYGTASQAVGNVVNRGKEAVEIGREAYNRAKPNGSASESTIG